MPGLRLPHPDAERRLFEWVQARVSEVGLFSDDVRRTLISAIKGHGLELTLFPGCVGHHVLPAGSDESFVARSTGAQLLVGVKLPPGTAIDGYPVDHSFLIGELPLADLGCELIGRTITYIGGSGDDSPSMH
jgi:hypothetical protein